MKTYYAICNANGPISRRVEADNPDQVETLIMDLGGDWIDEPSTHAEDDLDIAGEGMSEEEFAAAMEAAGWTPVLDADLVHNCQAGTSAHLEDGWMIWERA